MDRESRDHLETIVQFGGQAHVRNLALAETAVERGQFNVAKVLRAVAHAQFTRALAAARLLGNGIDHTEALGAHSSEWPGENARYADPSVVAFDERGGAVRAGVAAILLRAQASLVAHPDILERDVAQTLWGCYGCGNLTEGGEPAACAVCGTRPPGFRRFEPFYVATPEHLGQRTAAEILTILPAVPGVLAAAIVGLDEVALSRKPSPEEWSVKEILAHILETELFCVQRVRTILDEHGGEGIPVLDAPIAPWLLHEGKGYEETPTQAILDRLHAVRETTIALLRELEPEQWSWWGSNGGARTTILDLGTWLANHDLGHLAQVGRSG